MKSTQDNFPVITVIGKDKGGIVAQLSAYLWNNKINIEEIQQGVMQGNFFMVMSIDIAKSKLSITDISNDLDKLGKKIGVKMFVYDQEIFNVMNTI